MNRQFYYNRIPLVPIGTELIIQKNGTTRFIDKSWIRGWYIIPTLNHYIFCTCYVKKAIELIRDTVGFFTYKGNMPTLLSSETITKAEKEITDKLKKKHKITIIIN